MLISISKVFELFRNDEDSNEGLLQKFEYAWDEFLSRLFLQLP